MNTTDDRDSIPLCCKATVAVVQHLGRGGTCPACGEWYAPDPTTLPARMAMVPEPSSVDQRAPYATTERTTGPAPDPRIQVATDDDLRPSSAAPTDRITRVESPEYVRVRRLLTELRPDKGGPLGWAADGCAPVATGSSWTPAVRIQTSVETPAILPGAFQSRTAASNAPDFDRGYQGMPDEIRATLRWCQRHGTLAEGLRAFHLAASLHLRPDDVGEAWKALAEPLRMPARLGYGRRRVSEAMAAWWGEGVVVGDGSRPTPAEALRASAERGSAETGEMMARARARLSGVVAKYERNGR